MIRDSGFARIASPESVRKFAGSGSPAEGGDGLDIRGSQRVARAIALLASRSHNTELASVTQNTQSRPLSPVVPKARWRNGAYTTNS